MTRVAIFVFTIYGSIASTNNDMSAPVPGDLDNNGVVDANDASLFTLLLLDGFATYRTMFPTLDPFARADFTGDYRFDGADMSGFVDAYLNTP